MMYAMENPFLCITLCFSCGCCGCHCVVVVVVVVVNIDPMTLASLQQRDTNKASMMEKLGRSLVIVPCWWDCDDSRCVLCSYACLFLLD